MPASRSAPAPRPLLLLQDGSGLHISKLPRGEGKEKENCRGERGKEKENYRGERGKEKEKKKK